MLAAVWFAFASSASAGQGSDAPAKFDGRRLQLTTDSFASYFIRGTDTTLAGTVVNILTADGKLLTRIYTSVDPLVSHYDTIIDRRDDFRPVAHRSYSGGRVARLDFDSTAVKGWMRLPNGDSVTVNAALPPLVYNGASFDLIVRASELGDGFRLSLPAFQMGANVVATMQGRVTGSDTVDGRPCWVFRGDNAGIPVAFWIDKDTRALRRQVIQFRVDAMHVLSAPGRPVVSVTDAERRGLVVGPTMVRHRDFGFVVPLPHSGFAVDTALQREANVRSAGHPELFAWSLRDSTRSIVILIHVYKGFGGTEGALRRFARDMAGGFTPERGWQVLEDSVHWEADRKEARFTVVGRQGVYLKSRCIPSPPPRAPVLLVCAQGISTRDDGLDFVRDGLRTAERPQ